MNDDALEDFVGLALYSMEGEFKETEKPELKAISSQLMYDGVEQLDTRCKVGFHSTFTTRGAFVSKFEADFH